VAHPALACRLVDAPFTFTVFAPDVATLPGITPDSAGADVFAAIQASMLASAPPHLNHLGD
jgi:hypothetical protein